MWIGIILGLVIGIILCAIFFLPKLKQTQQLDLFQSVNVTHIDNNWQAEGTNVGDIPYQAIEPSKPKYEIETDLEKLDKDVENNCSIIISKGDK